MKFQASLLTLAAVFNLQNSAQAQTDLAPPSFPTANGGRAVFVDFSSAHYKITFDTSPQPVAPTSQQIGRTATVETTIVFDQSDSGQVAFDVVETPSDVKLDGASVTADLVKTPDGQTFVRVLSKESQPGSHTLTLSSPLPANSVRYEQTGGVAFAMFLSDLTDRRYMEAFVPSNLGYDAYAMTFELNFHGSQKKQEIYSNGKVTERASGSNAQVIVEFPATYNCMMPYLHIASEGTMYSRKADYQSIDGRVIPVTVYSKFVAYLTPFMDKALKVLPELEKDYGSWPHESLLVYALPSGGGMEYAGATHTEYFAISHEMFHSYHARSLAPAEGNAGWMDEAIAMWRDEGYQENPPLIMDPKNPKGPKLSRPADITNMANLGAYDRLTPLTAYREGEYFLRSLAKKFTAAGKSFKQFLREYHDAYNFKFVTTSIFQSEAEKFYGGSLNVNFQSGVYGIKGGSQSFELGEFDAPVKGIRATHASESSIHKILTPARFQEML